MKAPPWFPQSFFARTLWMVLIVVLFSKALTVVYLMMNEDMLIDRQYSHGAALTIRAYWSVDERDRQRIREASGLAYLPTNDDIPGEQHWPYTDIFQRQMQMELGPDTQTRLHATQPAQLWVRAPDLGDGWLAIPLYPHPLRGQRIWNVLGWFLGIGLLSTGAAWVFVRQLSQPFKRMVFATRQFGRGRSVRLPVGPDVPSEMAEVYNAFNQMAEDIEQGAQERELMLAGVSHDLRTPLTRLRLSLELMPESEHEMIEDMVRDIEDMDEILDQFIAFIRDSRDEPVNDGDLNELVREVAEPFNQNESRVRLLLNPLPSFPLRQVSMKRLLGNLIVNALKYGGSDAEVATYVAGEDSSPYIVLSVLDRGPGIDPCEMESICNPFTRGDKARSGKGAGLGLAIVKRIAAQHGGSFELRNREGGGLEARVCLPFGLVLPRGAV